MAPPRPASRASPPDRELELLGAFAREGAFSNAGGAEARASANIFAPISSKPQERLRAAEESARTPPASVAAARGPSVAQAPTPNPSGIHQDSI